MGEKPASSPDLPESPSARKRKRIGWWLTSAWGLVSVAIALATWDSTIKFHDLMEAVAAAFGPIALLWLILGYQQQGEELALQRQELEMQRLETKRLADETARQSVSTESTELYARREIFFRELEIVKKEIDRRTLIIIRHLRSVNVDGGSWGVDVSNLIERANLGEESVFLDALADIFKASGGNWARAAVAKKFGNDQKMRELFDVIEDLFDQAGSADPSGRVLAMLEGSYLGEVYFLLSVTFSYGRKYRSA
ncbi:MAG: hypothetical protein C6Y20_11295 [Tagaea sp. CACIAM 22H2]|nr:hypothetical protein [Tagaea sp. CACIAM 22H2]